MGMSMLISVLMSLASLAVTSAKPGGMIGMGGVVGMRRNDDLNSDYAFDVSDHNSGHPDISDYVLDIHEHDFNGVGHQVLSIPKIHPTFIKDYSDVGHQDYVERGAHLSLSDYGH